MKNDNLLYLNTNQNVKDKLLETKLDSHPHLKDNGDGGGNMSNDKYVTHQELNHAVDNLSNKIDLSTEKILHQTDNRFAEIEKQINDVKNTSNSNKEKINWLLYTVVGGIALSIITTIISNLLTK